MDKAQLVEEMAKSFYDEYREKCKNLTDRELQEINLKNTRIVGSTPVDTNNFQTISRCYAEGMVCKEILEWRKKYSEAIKSWRNNLHERKEEAILNLPAATSELGQLIAAILEFRGELNGEEICSLVKEYREVDDAEITKTLSDLEKEEILYKSKSKKYHLLNVCTPSLFPENIIEFANAAFKKYNETLDENHIKILLLLKNENAPLSRKDIIEKTAVGKFRAEDALLKLEMTKVLEEFMLDDFYVYYFKMLGERSN